jgi:hypothetical protein
MTTIGTLIVKLIGDTAQFSQSLNKAKGEAKGMGEDIKKSTAAIGGFNLSAIGAAIGVASFGAAIYKAGKFALDSANQFRDYGLQIQQAMIFTGQSAEETSRMIELADDMGVGFDTLRLGLQNAVKHGFDPSIEGLGKLADEFLTLAPGVERGAYLLENYGRSGFAMGKLMSLGGSGIREAADAIQGSIVMTDQAIAIAEDYRVAADQLSDSWRDVKLAVGAAVAPGLIGAFTIMTELIKEPINQTNAYRVAVDRLNDSFTGIDSATRSYTAMAEAAAKTAKETVEISQAAVKATHDYANFVEIARELGKVGGKSQVELIYDIISKTPGITDRMLADYALKNKMITQEQYNLTLATQAAAQKQGDAYLYPVDQIDLIRGGLGAIMNMPDITKVIEIITIGEIPDVLLKKRPKRHKQFGGDVYAGEEIIVGEAGPEAFVAPADGKIIPNDKLRSIGEVVKQIQNNYYGPVNLTVAEKEEPWRVL